MTDQDQEAHNQSREEKKQKFIAEKTPEWEATGARYRKTRLAYGMSIVNMSKMSGFSSSKLSGFEHGHPLLNREVIECSYRMAFIIKENKMIAAHKELLNA